MSQTTLTGLGAGTPSDVASRRNKRTRTGSADVAGRTEPPPHISTADVPDEYRSRLSADQLAWLRRGIGIVPEVPAGYAPGTLEDYQSDGPPDR